MPPPVVLVLVRVAWPFTHSIRLRSTWSMPGSESWRPSPFVSAKMKSPIVISQSALPSGSQACTCSQTPASQPATEQGLLSVSAHSVLSGSSMCVATQAPSPSQPGFAHSSVSATSSHGVLAATGVCVCTQVPASQPASAQSMPVSVHGVLSGSSMWSATQLPAPSQPGFAHSSVSATSSQGVLAATGVCVCTHVPASQPAFEQSRPVSVHGVLSGSSMWVATQAPSPSQPGFAHSSVSGVSSHGVLAATGVCSCTHVPASQPALKQSTPVSVHGVLSGSSMWVATQLPAPSQPGFAHSSVSAVSSHGVLAASGVPTHSPDSVLHSKDSQSVSAQLTSPCRHSAVPQSVRQSVICVPDCAPPARVFVQTASVPFARYPAPPCTSRGDESVPGALETITSNWSWHASASSGLLPSGIRTAELAVNNTVFGDVLFVWVVVNVTSDADASTQSAVFERLPAKAMIDPSSVHPGAPMFWQSSS